MTTIYIIAAIAIWLFLAWQTVRSFPNDGPELRGWMWFIPFIPVIYYLLILTGLVMVFIGIIVSGLIYKLKNKNEA